MGFLREVVTRDSPTGASSKRLVLVVSGMSLSLCTIILSIGACMGIDVVTALWAVTTPLAALSGVAYVGKKEGHELTPPKPPEVGAK